MGTSNFIRNHRADKIAFTLTGGGARRESSTYRRKPLGTLHSDSGFTILDCSFAAERFDLEVKIRISLLRFYRTKKAVGHFVRHLNEPIREFPFLPQFVDSDNSLKNRENEKKLTFPAKRGSRTT